jgi:uncharacterized RDD family membrane protein YckC
MIYKFICGGNMNTKRIIAGIIDFFITSFIQVILLSLFFIKPLMESGQNGNVFNNMVRCLIISYCSVSFMVIRDIIGKMSIGKKIMKLKIINKNNGEETAWVKRLMRNLTWLLGPVDLIVFLFTNERLGDKIVGTNVIGENGEIDTKIEVSKNISVNKTGKGFAIASLVLGIVGLIFGGILIIPGIIGFIFSFKGLKSEKKVMAIAGMVLNSLQIMLLIGKIIKFILKIV